MTNILFFMDTLSAGGAEKVLCTLVNNMDQQKFRITVQTLEEVDASQYLVPGIRYKAINRCKTAWGRKLFSYWLRLCAELKWLYPLYIRDDYDIEVAYLECGPTKILAGSTNKKALKLAWVHCDLSKKEGIAEQAEKLSAYYQQYHKVICVSNTVKESFDALFGQAAESVVLYNVNDESDILQKAKAHSVPQKDVPVMAAVGRLSYEKGVDRLLEACARLREAGLCFHLRIVGDGPERQKLEQMARTLNLEGSVEFMGFQTNPYPVMAQADMIVCPSRYEGLSTVVTEALILGKPVVTTPCSGMNELLGNSEYGLITADSVEGLYQGLKQMLDDPGLMDRYAHAAEMRGKVFTKAHILAQTEAFFESHCLKEPGGR